MLKDVKPTASSCAVKHDDRGVTVTLDVRSLDEHLVLERHFQAAGIAINKENPKFGGSRLGSTIVLNIRDEFMDAACAALSKVEIRRGVDYINGTKTPCENVNVALDMAHRHG